MRVQETIKPEQRPLIKQNKDDTFFHQFLRGCPGTEKLQLYVHKPGTNLEKSRDTDTEVSDVACFNLHLLSNPLGRCHDN